MYISYRKYNKLCKKILNQILNKNEKFEGIICPLYGGFYLADYLRRKLNIPIYFIQISSYNKQNKRGRITINSLVPDLDKEKKYLIVDDILDSGETQQAIKNLYFNNFFETAVLVTKIKDLSQYFGIYFNSEKWVIFWWEK